MSQISVLSKTEAKESPFQAWRTPRHIFDSLNAEMNYTLDACADAHNHLCDLYLTEADDAFTTPWHGDGAVWINPPYCLDFQEEALHKCLMEVRVAKRRPHVDLLVQASISTKWFLKAFQECEVNLFHGRIAFDLPPERSNPKSPAFSNALIRVRPIGVGPTGITSMRSALTGKVI
jgi:phage N-6-adenine-methyltransferase